MYIIPGSELANPDSDIPKSTPDCSEAVFAVEIDPVTPDEPLTTECLSSVVTITLIVIII